MSDPMPSDVSEAPDFTTAFQARLEDLLRWRRDVRHFLRDPVPAHLMADLMALVDLAPSVGLSQPWRFVSVESDAARDAVRANFREANNDALSGYGEERAGLYASLKLAGLEDAPEHLAVFVEPDPDQGHGLGRQTMRLTVHYSAVMAIHTLWLAARAHGLGLGWVSILDPDQLRDDLDVPADWELVGYLCLGWPEEETAEPELSRAGWEQRRDPEPPIRR